MSRTFYVIGDADDLGVDEMVKLLVRQDPDETITILPMFTRPSLNDGGTWLGDLEAGSEVVLQGVNADRTACLVEGLTMQGWSTMGWVVCNRLRFEEGD